MDSVEFARLFESALQLASERAEQRLGRAIPRTLQVKLYGGGHSGDILDVATAAQVLYLGEDTYYRIIDIAVVEVTPDRTVCFVRASQHRPGSFSQTWNDPAGYGPFKQIEAQHITVESG